MLRLLAVLILVAPLSFGQSRNRTGEYALILKDLPVAAAAQSRADLFSARAKTQVAQIRSAQANVAADLKRRGIAVRRTSQLLANAIFVHTDAATASKLASIAGVARVQFLPPVTPDLNTALDLENVSAAWSAVGGVGNAGVGMRIGIIDSGIDQTHPGFQDSSLKPPSGFPRGDSNFTNSKVIVARSYIQPQTETFDSPDDLTPRDRIGHGTAIAMIAAGVQNTGPQGTIQGVAPKAFLGNYKIFGSPGVNTFLAGDFSTVAQALTDALADGMDVVTLAVNEGDPAQFGPVDTSSDCGGACDIRVQVVENAVKSGLVVVTSAGNSNGTGLHTTTLGSVHTPGTAPSAITVGASTNSHAVYQTVRTGSGTFNARFGDGPKPSGAIRGALVDVVNLGNDGTACSALPAGSLNGKIAIVSTAGTCVPSDKINFAQQAGAVGVILYPLSATTAITGSLGAQNTGIPAVMVGAADGVTLRALATSNPGTSATMDPAPVIVNATANQVAPFSSRGPSIGNFATPPVNSLKPELVAVGDGIYTATQKYDPNGEAYNATGYTGVSGTSYAVPMVAGAIALVKQKNPNINTPAKLKSAVVNTATQDVQDFDGSVARVNAVGAGKLSVGDAVNVAATLDPATLSFGALTAASLPIRLKVIVTNVSSTATTFTFAVEPRDSASATVSVSPTTLSLQPGANDTLTVTLSGTVPAAGSYEGFVTVTGAGAGPKLRLPYEFMVGTNVPYDIYPILSQSFFAGAGDQRLVDGFRLSDQFGVPVRNSPVLFSTSGGASIALADPQTALYGVAAAQVNMPSQPGYQTVTATAGTLSFPFKGFARAYPTIVPNGVVDAASAGFAQKGMAPGSYISVFGSNLADAIQSLSTPYLPVALSAVSISFDGDGLSFPGYLQFVSPGQINTQIPWEFQGHSSVGLTVWATGLPTATYTVPLAPVAPGIFTIAGTAAAIDANLGTVVTTSTPAKRGDIVELFVNGLGAVDHTPASGQPTSTTDLTQTTATPTVSIGGVPADVKFSGLAPGIVGLYQVNVLVPQNAPTGNPQVTISIGGVTSAAANLPIQ